MRILLQHPQHVQTHPPWSQHTTACPAKHKYWLHTPSLDPVGFIHHRAAVCTQPCVLYNMQDNYSLYTQVQSAHIIYAGLQSVNKNTTCTHNTNTVCRHKYYLNTQVQSAYTNLAQTGPPHSHPPLLFPKLAYPCSHPPLPLPKLAHSILTHPFPCLNWPTPFSPTSSLAQTGPPHSHLPLPLPKLAHPILNHPFSFPNWPTPVLTQPFPCPN